MVQRFNGEEQIGLIVSEFPGASNLFKEVHIDFCCGGERSLLQAIRQKKLDENEILRRLNEDFTEMIVKAESRDTDWREVPIPELIDHIVNRHHSYLRKELPLLSEFITKILRVHGGAHAELSALHKRFHQMKIELDQHLITEEEELFPLIKQYASQPTIEMHERTVTGLHELETDHREVGDYLKEMRAITNGYALPPEACRTYTITFHKLGELESDLFQHIHLENNILFPRIIGENKQDAQLCAPLRRLKQEHIPLRHAMDAFHSTAERLIASTGAERNGTFRILYNQVDDFTQQLKKHAKKEDDGLFPMMAAYIGREAGPIAVMEYEHELAEHYLQQFLNAAGQVESGTGDEEVNAIADYAVEAYTILSQHFCKEENVLFPMAENSLSNEEKEQLNGIVQQK